MTDRPSDQTPADARYREYLRRQGVTGDEAEAAIQAWRESLDAPGETPADARYREHLEQQGVTGNEAEAAMQAWRESLADPGETPADARYREYLEQQGITGDEAEAAMQAWRQSLADPGETPADARYREYLEQQGVTGDEAEAAMQAWRESLADPGETPADAPTPASTMPEPDAGEVTVAAIGVDFASSGRGGDTGPEARSEAEDRPVATSSRRPSRRSSADGFDSGPYAPSNIPSPRGRPIIPAAIAVLVVVLALAGAFVLFRPGGDEPVPASAGSPNATAGVGASTTEPTAVATEAGVGTAGQDLPQGTPNTTIDMNALAAQFFAANSSPAQRATALTYVDRRPDSGAATPEWVDGVSAFFFIDVGGEAWVQIDAPQALASNLCGEVDIITGRNEHAGDGIDFCTQGAQAPYYFTAVAPITVPSDAARVTIIVRSGQVLVADNDRVSVWVFDATDADNFQAAEFVGQTAFAPPVDASPLDEIEIGLGFEAVGPSVAE